MAGFFCTHGKKSSLSTEGGEIFDYPTDYSLLKTD
jgi:hypothetical protein